MATPLSALHRLPYEIMAFIVNELDIEEIFDLSRTCRHFQYLIRNERFCRVIIAIKGRYTLEQRDAEVTGYYSRALRRLVKRRRALAEASPYALGILGHATSYLYRGGSLCYIIEDRPARFLRILDLHDNADQEVVVGIPRLVAIVQPRASASSKYKFKILNHANSITSCMLSFRSHGAPYTEHWLVCFNARQMHILIVEPLSSACKVFVRNNSDYLYFGAHSELGPDNYKRWVLRGYDIRRKSWFPQKLHLPDVVGYDMDSTVCFEIIGDYFYGVSNQTEFEIGEVSWTSFYHCFRFPISDPQKSRVERMTKTDSWRRQHSEGPIDDRWSFMKLDQDEATGQITIIEMRKEWQVAESHNIRSYYTTPVLFRTHDSPEFYDVSNAGSQNQNQNHGSGAQPVTAGSGVHADDWMDLDRPHMRSPQYCHMGDDSATTEFQSRNKTHLLAYHRFANVFLDLIQDTEPNASENKIRLRSGYRRPKPMASIDTQALKNAGNITEQASLLYHANEITLWPPHKSSNHMNTDLERINRVLTPKGGLGTILATGDERSIVYMTGAKKNKPGTLIYLSFDPAAKLHNMKKARLVRGEKETDPTPSEAILPDRGHMQHDPARDPQPGTSIQTLGGTSTLRQIDDFTLSGPNPALTRQWEEGPEIWARRETAIHLELPSGFVFVEDSLEETMGR